MPLLYIDLVEGRTPAEVQSLLDALHAAVVKHSGCRRAIVTRWCGLIRPT
jgi:phenylpyruvate tautomerase PptA (4-oxalocrotonate tautomerase family)